MANRFAQCISAASRSGLISRSAVSSERRFIQARSISEYLKKFAQKEEGPKEAGQDKSSSSSKTDNTSESSEKQGPYALVLKLAGLFKSELMEKSLLAQKAEPYNAPVKLQREEKLSSPIEINEEATGVVLHKSSKWASTWQGFRDNNPLANKWFEWKMKFDESDNLLVRATRSVTDTVVTNVAGVFEEGEMSQTLSEIAKVDPNFDKDQFLVYVEKQVIPPVLEAFYAGDLVALKGWVAEDSFGVFEAQVKAQQDAGMRVDYKIMDVRNVDLAMAKVLDDAPVLILTFSVHQIICVRDKLGTIKEGNEDDVQDALYVIALRRDPSNFDPKLAWEVMELGMQYSHGSW